MTTRRFAQVDVFTAEACLGNPVAVVLDADGLTTDEMARFARWTNLSETTFVLPPSDHRADYRVRIFTPTTELPFAGHPTLGTCHAWLSAGGQPRQSSEVIQECGVGLVRLRRDDARWSFAAPPLIRSGEVDEPLIERVADVLGIRRAEIVDAQWADNGPGWVAVMVRDAEAVLALRPRDAGDLYIGVVGAYPPGSSCAIEVRAFFPKGTSTDEDPVTGSLNASLAQWLLGNGRLVAPYVASQGTALGRAGRVHVSSDVDDIWIGGDCVTCVEGTVAL
jgi:PhzF family phenazine biosynthesis protein